MLYCAGLVAEVEGEEMEMDWRWHLSGRVFGWDGMVWRIRLFLGCAFVVCAFVFRFGLVWFGCMPPGVLSIVESA